VDVSKKKYFFYRYWEEMSSRGEMGEGDRKGGYRIDAQKKVFVRIQIKFNSIIPNQSLDHHAKM